MSMRYTCDRCGEPAQDESGRLAGSATIRAAGHIEEGGGDLCRDCLLRLLLWWRRPTLAPNLWPNAPRASSDSTQAVP